ncbi:MAG: helix-turn-helix domain-containing protein, partial [Treponema porcinum]|nr:helix-turn-helix domain-containing protein [Treponema porcinum]
MTSLPVTVTLYLYMGNGKTSTKHTVLEILRESRAAVSGEEIAQKTGVSRVSVCKAVPALQAAG